MDIVFAVNERFTHLACCVNMEKDPSSLKDFTAVSENRSKNQLRSEIREACNVSEHILKSNQTSHAKDNLRLLNNYICELVEQNICDSDVNRKCHLYHLKSLRAVLEMMVAKAPSKHPDKDITISFISFDEAFDLFLVIPLKLQFYKAPILEKEIQGTSLPPKVWIICLHYI